MRERDAAAEAEVRDTLGQLRALSPPPLDAAAAGQRRARLTRAMRASLQGGGVATGGAPVPWRRVLGWGALAAGAMAAVALVAGPGRGTRPADHGAPAPAGAAIAVVEGALTVDSAGATQPLAPGQQRIVGERDVLQTAATGGAAVRLEGVGRMTLQPASRVVGVVATTSAISRVTLAQGRAHLSIAKLGPGRTFRVVTEAATVQVHGTEFDVEIGAGSTPHTCVRVQDGLVEVIAGVEPAATRTFVKPGQTWGCDDAGAAVAAPRQEVAPPTQEASPASRRAVAGHAANAPTAGALRRQNQLFEEALRAQRAGDRRQAADLYRRLVDGYPNGPLARQATRQLDAMRASD